MSESELPQHPEHANRAKIDFQFRKELVKEVGSESFYLCFQCGACVGSCPAAKVSKEFNPRRIVLDALIGLRGALVAGDSVIWKCTTCYNCYERCPHGVSPVAVIAALKRACARGNLAPREFLNSAETIKKTGRAVPATGAIEKRRAALGLPPLPKMPLEEIRLLCVAGSQYDVNGLHTVLGMSH